MNNHTIPYEPDSIDAPLIDLMRLSRELNANLTFDIKYASTDNFTSQVVYSQASAFFIEEGALALCRIATELNKHGYGLRIFDAYRPWHITAYFWDNFPKDHLYLADPEEGSRHNRGCAIDLSLYDLKTGKEVSMPSQYDEFNKKSHLNYAGGTDAQNALRTLLQTTMLAHGFTSHPYEWWHFDFGNWQKYRVRDDAFETLKV